MVKGMFALLSSQMYQNSNVFYFKYTTWYMERLVFLHTLFSQFGFDNVAFDKII